MFFSFEIKSYMQPDMDEEDPVRWLPHPSGLFSMNSAWEATRIQFRFGKADLEQKISSKVGF